MISKYRIKELEYLSCGSYGLIFRTKTKDTVIKYTTEEEAITEYTYNRDVCGMNDKYFIKINECILNCNDIKNISMYLYLYI